ncbi:ARM repeat-containing protein [Serendipita vermifera]|nr:ARM repeat-containing protein [Serendipita vermifera]
MRLAIVQDVSKVVACLTDRSPYVRAAALHAFETLSQYSEMQLSIVQDVPKVIACFTDPYSGVRQAAMNVLGTLSQQSNMRLKFIHHAPNVLLCLHDSSPEVQETALNTIGILVQYPEFVIEIGDLQTIFAFLHHRRDTLVCAAINVTGQIAEYNTTTIHAQIPILINLLGHTAPDVRAAAVAGLCRMAQIDEFEALIEAEAPRIANSLGDPQPTVRKSAVTALCQQGSSSKLSKCVALQSLTRYKDAWKFVIVNAMEEYSRILSKEELLELELTRWASVNSRE